VKSLEAALWAFYKTENFRDGCLAAANLGGDADTTAAICGMLMGAFYGASNIPSEWRQRLAFFPYVETLCDALIALAESGSLLSDPDESEPNEGPSPTFLQAHKCFSFMELAYRPIRDRLLPGPKQYPDLATFDSEVRKFLEEYELKTPNWTGKLALIEDMRARIIEKGRQSLQARLAKPKILFSFAKKE
jgi:hypothetical protein